MRVQIKKNFVGIKDCGVHLWQILIVNEVFRIGYNPKKYPNEVLFYRCYMPNDNTKFILLDYTEVTVLDKQ